MEKEAINQAIREATGIDLDDFYSDLNAMHEAEKFIPDRLIGGYTSNIAKHVQGLLEKRSIRRSDTFHMLYVCATAAQRAEAFLKTLNLWKD